METYLPIQKGETKTFASMSSSSIDTMSSISDAELKSYGLLPMTNINNKSNISIDSITEGPIPSDISDSDSNNDNIDKMEIGNKKENVIVRKDRSLFYAILTAEIEGILEEETDFLANTSNISSFIYNKFHESLGKDTVNWIGFYFVRTVFKNSNNDNNKEESKELRLGPFHGKYACVRIPFGKGVCGDAALNMKSILVNDVHLYPNHISCDEASQSEVVLPLIDANNNLIGLLDIDCPKKFGFDENDQKHLENIAKLIVQGCQWPQNGTLLW